MSVDEALGKWNDACAALVSGEVVWMNGNREPLSVSLSHHPQAQIEETDLKSPRSDWKAVVKVTESGETEASFYLCVE
jgi:hypothetical protein